MPRLSSSGPALFIGSLLTWFCSDSEGLCGPFVVCPSLKPAGLLLEMVTLGGGEEETQTAGLLTLRTEKPGSFQLPPYLRRSGSQSIVITSLPTQASFLTRASPVGGQETDSHGLILPPPGPGPRNPELRWRGHVCAFAQECPVISPWTHWLDCLGCQRLWVLPAFGCCLCSHCTLDSGLLSAAGALQGLAVFGCGVASCIALET